jgi:hypothetical protein
MSETDLQRAILEAIAARGYWAMRVNAGTHAIAATGEHARRVIRSAPKGTPDILVIKPYGWIEVKLLGGSLRESQVAWHTRAEREGLRCMVVRSIAEALRWVDRWARDDAVRGKLRRCPVGRCPLEEP